MKRALLLLVLLACGHEPARTVPPVATVAAVPTPPPADPVARMWPIEAPDTLARVDVRALRGTAVGEGLLRSAGALGQRLSGERAKCFADALAGVSEIVAGADHDGWVAIVRYDPARVASPRACFDESVAVATPSPGWLVAGTQALVTRATAQNGRGEPLARVALHPNEVARAFFPSDREHRIDASLSVTDSALALRGEGEVSGESTRMAERLAVATPHQIEGALRLIRPTLDPATIDRLTHAFAFSVHGTHVEGAFTLTEPGADQARDVSLLLDAGMQRYLTSAKETEARATVRAISRSLAAWWEAETPKPRKKKLVSFPPVPKTVPRGTTYASTAADWAAWAPLRFAMDAPQRYQYEVEAAKDGKSANVVARGDLNGDGKTSEFRVHVEVNATGGLDVSPALVEVNPDE